jgi:hypothetical protein
MDIENQTSQIILTSIAVFLFFVIIVIIYQSNKKCNNHIYNNEDDDRNNKKEKYEEIQPNQDEEIQSNQDEEFLNKNVYQNTGLGIKDYEYLVNYPNGKGSCGEWSWGTNTSQNCKGNCSYSTTINETSPFKERNINNLFKF